VTTTEICERILNGSAPEGLSVEGNLSLGGCTSLATLPARLSVGGCLELSGCTSLATLPESLSVGGDRVPLK
jgi:hypothetical protein